MLSPWHLNANGSFFRTRNGKYCSQHLECLCGFSSPREHCASINERRLQLYRADASKDCLLSSNPINTALSSKKTESNVFCSSSKYSKQGRVPVIWCMNFPHDSPLGSYLLILFQECSRAQTNSICFLGILHAACHMESTRNLSLSAPCHASSSGLSHHLVLKRVLELLNTPPFLLELGIGNAEV